MKSKPSTGRPVPTRSIPFARTHGLLPLAVCSRITEYEALGVQLRLQGAIVVQPLTRAQVDSYLAQVGEPLAAVREVLQEDPMLWELLDTPLMLTIVTLAYAGQPAEALRTRGTLVERRQSLFATYVDRMFQRRSAVTRYTRPQTERWLAWLAWQLTQHSQTVFYLERLQPDWLPVGRRWLPTQGARLLAGLVGLVAGLVVGLVAGLLLGLLGSEPVAPSAGRAAHLGSVVGLIAGLIGGLTGYSREITPIETVRWSWSKFLSELLLPSRHSLRDGLLGGALVGLGVGLLVWLSGWPAGLGLGLIAGLVAGLGGGLVVGLVVGLGGGLVLGLVVGLVVGLGRRAARRAAALIALAGLVLGLVVGLVYKLSTGLAAGLSGGEITTKTVPNEGIYRSARMAVSSGLGCGLLFGLARAGVGLSSGWR